MTTATEVRPGDRGSRPPEGSPTGPASRVPRWDLPALVLGTHAAALLVLGDVRHPEWAAASAAAFVLWRLGWNLAARRRSDSRAVAAGLVGEAGSLVLATTLLVADGGTESPFFFWTLIILSWQALGYSLRHFTLLAAVAVASYVTAMAAAGDVTPASIGRLALFVAYGATLAAGRSRLERRDAEIRRSREFFSDVFAHAPVGLAIVFPGPMDRIGYVNAGARDVGLEDLLASSEGEDLRRLVDRARDTAETAGPEQFAVRTGSRTRYLRVMAAPQPVGRSGAVLVSAEDVTAQVTAGEERRRFLLLASHQLRTPLTPIVAYGELLHDGRLDGEETRIAAAEMIQAGRDLQRLFERMTVVAGLQHGAPPPEGRPVRVRHILQTVQDLQPGILDGVEVSGADDRLVCCDPEWIARALRELIDNGHQFGRPPVRVGWTGDGGGVEVRVTDAGPGPDPTLPADALFGDWGKGRADDTMPPGMGTRLGLLQARLLTELAGGQLTVERAPSEWAFVLRLPPRPAP